MKFVLILTIASVLTGCGGLIKRGAMVEAQDALNEADYAEALESTDIAEAFGELSEAETAKLHYLRGQALQGLSRYEEAKTNYQYVVDQHPKSAYARASQQKMNTLNTN